MSERSSREAALDMDRKIHKLRHLIENFFCGLKEFWRLVMRGG